MKFQSDPRVNKTMLKVGYVVEQLNEMTTMCLKRVKRKDPSSCKVEGVKRLKSDKDEHDDQGPSPHEGEKKEAAEPN